MNYPAPSALLNPLNFRLSGSVSKVRNLCFARGWVQTEISGEGSVPPSPSSSGFPTDGEQGLTLCMCPLHSRDLSTSQLWTLKGSATLGSKTTGRVHLSPHFFVIKSFYCMGRGRGGGRKENVSFWSADWQLQLPWELTTPNFIQDIRRKNFPVTKLPWHRNFPIAEPPSKFFRNEHCLKHLIHENWRRPSPLLVWLRSPPAWSL